MTCRTSTQNDNRVHGLTILTPEFDNHYKKSFFLFLEMGLNSVRFVARGGVGVLPSHWLMTTMVTAKFGLGVRFDPSEKSKIQIRR